MNIIFFGSSNFAVLSLKALLTAQYKISCVVTQPDRQRGRGLNLEPTSLKKAAGELGFECYQPQDINSPAAINFLSALNPDLFVVIAYGQILSESLLNIPQIFALNIHGSVLPKYRGAAPINWAIIRGEKTTGVTAIKMTKGMDAGPMLMQRSLNIAEDETALTLESKLSEAAASLLLDSLKAIKNNAYELVPQDKAMISFAPKLKKEDGLINWKEPAQNIHNLVRGCLGWPCAFTYYKTRLLKIFKANAARAPGHQSAGTPERRDTRAPGEIIEISKKGIVVACGTDSLIIEELQIEGKRRMKTGEFIAGHKIETGQILG